LTIAAAMLTIGGPAAVEARADGNGDAVAVDRLSFGWISTTVVDGGSSSPNRPAKSRAAKPRVVHCTQHKSDSAGGYASPDQFTGDYPDAGAGGWVIRKCSDGSMSTAWVPAPVTAATVERLAQRATNRLPLPLPSPRFNPSRPSSAGPATLVAIPTWFWVEGWQPVTQRTRAGGVWAEVVASPVAATWYPGDGSPPVRCVANEAWRPGAAPSSCEHVYTRSSAGQPGNAYRARVVVTWQVRWTGSGGRSGSLPLMQRQLSFPIAVAERQTVVTVGGEP
jgi:hypothetical protein